MNPSLIKLYLRQFKDHAQVGAKLIQELATYAKKNFEGAIDFESNNGTCARFSFYGLKYIVRVEIKMQDGGKRFDTILATYSEAKDPKQDLTPLGPVYEFDDMGNVNVRGQFPFLYFQAFFEEVLEKRNTTFYP